MLQDILVLIIIWTAVLYTIYQMVKTFIPSRNKTSAKCDGCSGCALKPDRKKLVKDSFQSIKY